MFEVISYITVFIILIKGQQAESKAALLHKPDCTLNEGGRNQTYIMEPLLSTLQQCLNVDDAIQLSLFSYDFKFDGVLGDILPILHKMRVTPLVIAAAETTSISSRAFGFRGNAHLFYANDLQELMSLQPELSGSAAANLSTQNIVLFPTIRNLTLFSIVRNWALKLDVWRLSVFFYDPCYFETKGNNQNDNTVLIKTIQHGKFRLKWKSIQNLSEICNESENIEFIDLERRVPYSLVSRHYKKTFIDLNLTVVWTNKQGKKIYDGTDAYIARIFQKLIGYELTNYPPKDQALGFEKNGTYNGIVGQLQKAIVDVSFNALYFSQNINRIAQYTASIYREPYIVVVQRAATIPFGLVLLRPFNGTTWTVFLGTLVVTSLTWYAAYNLLSQSNVSRSNAQEIGRCFLNITQTMLQGGTTRRVSTIQQRMVHAALLFSVLILNTAYSGQLLGFLASPPRYPDMQTLAEAADLRYVYIPGTYRSYLDDPEAPASIRALRSKIRIQSWQERQATLLNIIHKGRDGNILPLFRFQYYSQMKELTVKDERQLHFIPEAIFSPGHAGYLVRKYCPLFHFHNKFILTMIDGGFNAIWQKWQVQKQEANGLRIPAGDVTRMPKPLRPMQLQGPFFVLWLGIIASLLSFIVELVVGQIQKRRQGSKKSLKDEFSQLNLGNDIQKNLRGIVLSIQQRVRSIFNKDRN